MMHIEFKVGLDKTDSLNYPNFEPAEIDLWLNKAQDKFVKQRYSHDVKGETFEETQKRTDDLRTVVEETTLPPSTTQVPIKPNGILFDVPVGGATPVYWFAINEECEIRYEDCNGSWQDERRSVKPIQHDDYNKIVKDPFNKPSRNTILRLMHGTFFELITDGTFTVTQYFLRYLRQPVRVDIAVGIDCELAEHTHQEIVAGAVTLALENIGSPRFQTHVFSEVAQD